uniref:(northern house mosquito) hypothetical protein n=1 Tax=Culex pipiens TaxID=7175 RepID=A0A8D8GY06_CULPI
MQQCVVLLAAIGAATSDIAVPHEMATPQTISAEPLRQNQPVSTAQRQLLEVRTARKRVWAATHPALRRGRVGSGVHCQLRERFLGLGCWNRRHGGRTTLTAQQLINCDRIQDLRPLLQERYHVGELRVLLLGCQRLPFLLRHVIQLRHQQLRQHHAPATGHFAQLVQNLRTTAKVIHHVMDATRRHPFHSRKLKQPVDIALLLEILVGMSLDQQVPDHLVALRAELTRVDHLLGLTDKTVSQVVELLNRGQINVFVDEGLKSVVERQPLIVLPTKLRQSDLRQLYAGTRNACARPRRNPRRQPRLQPCPYLVVQPLELLSDSLMFLLHGCGIILFLEVLLLDGLDLKLERLELRPGLVDRIEPRLHLIGVLFQHKVLQELVGAVERREDGVAYLQLVRHLLRHGDEGQLNCKRERSEAPHKQSLGSWKEAHL